MEVAVGEYEVDFNKMMSSALKKYYEDRDKHYLEMVASTEDMFRKKAGTFYQSIEIDHLNFMRCSFVCAYVS